MTIMESFSCILILQQLHLKTSICIILLLLHWNIYIFGQEMFGLAPTYDIKTEMSGGKWCQHLDIMHESSYTLLVVTWKFLLGMQENNGLSCMPNNLEPSPAVDKINKVTGGSFHKQGDKKNVFFFFF